MAKLYVGNLPDCAKEKDLRELFESFGTVEEVAVMRGYAFIVSVLCTVPPCFSMLSYRADFSGGSTCDSMPGLSNVRRLKAKGRLGKKAVAILFRNCTF